MAYSYTTVKANQLFWAMIQASHRKGEGSADMLGRTIIGIDPGETTGFGYRVPWEEGFKIHLDQIKTQDRNAAADEIQDRIIKIFELYKGNMNARFDSYPLIVCEDYRVYGHKTDQHAWAGLHTPKLIGQIERVAYQLRIPMVTPMAIEGKSFATDQNLKSWDLYDPGMKHARDASRHIVTKAFFGSPISLDS